MRRMSFRRRAEMFGQRPTESAMQEAVLNFLNLMPDTVAWPMSTLGKPRYLDGKQVGWWRNPREKGKPDIGGFKGTIGFVIELKLPGETLSPDQVIWRDHFIKRTGAGWRYRVCRGVDEVEAFWEGLKNEE